MHGDTYFCFVVYNDNEQEEAGDTLIHTFVKRSWPVCETRWFYFWGSVSGVTCKSTTAIFQLHFAIEIDYFLNSNSNRYVYKSWGTWPGVHDAAQGLRVHIGPAPDYLLEAGSWLTASYFIARAFHFFDTSSIPVGRTPVEGFLSLYAWSISFEVPRPHIYITQGVQDDPVTKANYGDQLPYTTILGEGDLSTFVLNNYNNLDLNQAGLLFINKGGITRLCLRDQHDIENYAPWPYSTRTSLAYYSELAGAGKRPILTLCFPPQ